MIGQLPKGTMFQQLNKLLENMDLMMVAISMRMLGKVIQQSLKETVRFQWIL